MAELVEEVLRGGGRRLPDPVAQALAGLALARAERPPRLIEI
jgi:hypothetical protein